MGQCQPKTLYHTIIHLHRTSSVSQKSIWGEGAGKFINVNRNFLVTKLTLLSNAQHSRKWGDRSPHSHHHGTPMRRAWLKIITQLNYQNNLVLILFILFFNSRFDYFSYLTTKMERLSLKLPLALCKASEANVLELLCMTYIFWILYSYIVQQSLYILHITFRFESKETPSLANDLSVFFLDTSLSDILHLYIFFLFSPVSHLLIWY